MAADPPSPAYLTLPSRQRSVADQVRRPLQIGCDVSERCLPPTFSPTPETSLGLRSFISSFQSQTRLRPPSTAHLRFGVIVSVLLVHLHTPSKCSPSRLLPPSPTPCAASRYALCRHTFYCAHLSFSVALPGRQRSIIRFCLPVGRSFFCIRLQAGRFGKLHRLVDSRYEA